MAFISNALKRQRAEEALRKKHPRWDTFDITNKRYLIDALIDEFKYDIEDADNTFAEAHEFDGNATFFMAGIAVGVVGGMFANVMHDFFKENFSPWYQHVTLIAFVCCCIGLFILFKLGFNRILRSHPLIAEVLDELKNK